MKQMLDAASRGFQRFNFGGTWKNQESVYRFKNRWDATDIPYRYYINNYPGYEILLAEHPATILEKAPGFYLYPISG